jgi:hypothetical protein
MHATPMVKALIVDLDEGPEITAASTVVILKLLNAPVCAGVASRAVGAV